MRLDSIFYRDIVKWNPVLDAALMDAIADGRSFTEAARVVGVTSSSAWGRFRRLAAKMGPQAA